ncbi:preprotein translocase subunit SecA, partial [Candidatus Peregrinibacteria bacterium RIFOXYB2_FULL_32_7]
MLREIIAKIIGDSNAKYIRSLQPLVDKINILEQEYDRILKLEDFPKKTEEFKKRIKDGESLDSILPEAFALVKNACRKLQGRSWKVREHDKIWDMIPYDVQLIGGIALHQGKISEMKTGEGKTLVATMPLYLNALNGKGAYLVTVNDYLAHRDSEWMRGIYEFLGLTVGVIYNHQKTDEKEKAYACDITYGTNNEFGFDYLRDNMATRIDDVVQKYLHYAIVDEVDSILIDEARTPLIISAPAEDSTDKYMTYARLVKNLKENEDYNIDEKQKTAVLTEEGIAKMEKFLGVENIYTEKGFQEVNHIEQALKAISVYEKDVDYVINNNEIIIVDEFTGRLMPGRRFSSGLHQAIEAKEGVAIKRESKTLASISFQNYFRLFKRLAGMTGTALTEAEEFTKIYGLEVIVIPTNKPVKRDDSHDAIYKNEKAKFNAVCKEVKEINEKGQPVLIGTISIEKSEKLSNLLKQAGISHTVLNAKYHEKEAEIIAKAGEKNAVTIATNMAGRGTDIKLGDGVKDLGGLYIIGTERHESRRIDNQLRGRAGRQGDPGISQFYVSMDDQVMRIFGGDRIKKVMDTLNLPD